MLRAAAEHRGSAFVEIFQNCPIFNDDAFDFVRDDKEGVNRIVLQQRRADPLGQGRREGAAPARATARSRCARRATTDVLVHDATHEEPSLAFALSRVTQATHGGTPVGVFRNVERPVYDDLMAEQLRDGRGEARQGRSRGAAPLRRDLGRRLASR